MTQAGAHKSVSISRRCEKIDVDYYTDFLTSNAIQDMINLPHRLVRIFVTASDEKLKEFFSHLTNKGIPCEGIEISTLTLTSVALRKISFRVPTGTAISLDIVNECLFAADLRSGHIYIEKT